MKNIVFIVLTILSLSCSNKKLDNNTNSKNEQTEVSIDNKLYDIWLLKKINEKDIATKRQLILEINTKEMTFMGNAHCNNFSGKLSTNKNSISFNNTMSNQMACQELNQENLYLGTLENVKYFEIKNLHLLLFDKNKKLVLEYQKVD